MSMNLEFELYKACLDGDVANAKRLLEAGADVNFGFADTSLSVAAKKGHYELVRLLLNNGASVDKIGSLGLNAICNACGETVADSILDLLALRGANVNSTTTSG